MESSFVPLRRKNRLTEAARTSAIGNDIQTPNKPKYIGKIIIRGTRKNPCLVSVSNMAGIALPMA